MIRVQKVVYNIINNLCSKKDTLYRPNNLVSTFIPVTAKSVVVKGGSIILFEMNVKVTNKYFVLLLLGCITVNSIDPEEEQGVKYADKCEVCKILATELESRLEETGKTSVVIETGYAVDDVKPKKKKEYKKSELRLIESLDGVCERILKYNIHKEREDSTRFAKGMSQTFQTLHGLVDKGVKVELGIPYELWDKPSAEITKLKTQCETLLEENEGDIEDWYFNHQGKESLKKYLCEDRALRHQNSKCLYENLKGEKGEEKTKKRKKQEL